MFVDIGFDTGVNYAALSHGAQLLSQATGVPALLDTGAAESCIDDSLARSINLPIIDRVMVSGVGGATEVNVYLAHIVVPAIGYIQWGRFAGALLTNGGQVHRALIGRTLLRDVLVVYDGREGKVKLAY
ncbi:aspartyl protease family protein [Magnetospirillum molischianum]|uniref:aspartyl protease family protein n=1 Tax=Magnetospirillum molischianum TaxID=1083 RepID=UPI0002DDDD56|nr:aspartyl protease family protein [Magnetospirillum molischianum]